MFGMAELLQELRALQQRADRYVPEITAALSRTAAALEQLVERYDKIEPKLDELKKLAEGLKGKPFLDELLKVRSIEDLRALADRITEERARDRDGG